MKEFTTELTEYEKVEAFVMKNMMNTDEKIWINTDGYKTGIC